MEEGHRLAPPHCAVTSSDFAHERCRLADVCFVVCCFCCCRWWWWWCVL